MKQLVISLALILIITVSTQADTAIFPLTTMGRGSHADIDGNLAVWLYNSGSNDNAIYGYNFSTQATFTIMRNDHTRKQSPRISGQYVAWSTDWAKTDNNQFQVWLKDLSTGYAQQINERDIPVNSLDIDGGYVAWIDADVWVYDITQSDAQQLTTDETIKHAVSVSAPWVVWYCDLTTVMGYNISTTELVTLVNSVTWPSVGDDVLLYSSGTSVALRSLDLVTGVTQTITSTVQLARTDGDTVVWSDDSGVWAYDLASRETVRVIARSGTYDPSVSGDRFVWRQHDDNDYNIWAGRLSWLSSVFGRQVWLPAVWK